MRRLPSLIVFLVYAVMLKSQTSPHGAGFRISCMDCHSATGWTVDVKKMTFDHATTRFPLTGLHRTVDCRQCHTTLEFARAGTECIDCHTDMHNQTVGPECDRCHTTDSWVVNNITEMHQKSRFPLVGAHMAADCYDCHRNAATTLLDFQPLGIECYDCHESDYKSTTSPNHEASNYSKNCTDCHQISAFSWSGATTDHSFFPLTMGHAISNCQECHKTPEYASTSPVCYSCHQPTYDATTNPNHNSIGFSTDCKSCHTTNPGWKPAEYREHDAKSFPIYSGKHLGEWNACSDCHKNPASYAQNTCIDCHEHNAADMNSKHGDVQGYAYESSACLACHPTGSAEETFNHANSSFPLTGAHLAIAADCNACHQGNYTNTPNTCAGCHMPNYNATTNPNHPGIGIPTECNTCHTTNPNWKPATFPIHNNYYMLAGAHTTADCNTCHNGSYNSTPNTCAGCHLTNYNQTTNPPHVAAQFPTTCSDCHTQTAWTPATWDHDGQYFPIYSGKHNGKWDVCFDCHTNQANYSVFTCTTSCHPQSSTNNDHTEVTGYAYNSAACYSCHPQGSAGGKIINRQGRINPKEQ